MARECTQAWGPPPSVSRTDHSMDVEEDSDASSPDPEVPCTTASVTSLPAISTSPVTVVCSTVTAPTPCPTVAVNVSTGSTTAASVSTASTVTTASAPKSSRSDVSVPRPKKPRTVVSHEIFYERLIEHFPGVDLPSFDNAKGKEWDTRAKAYIRQKVKTIFDDKRIGITNSDLASWEYGQVASIAATMCEILSIRNYLTSYVTDVLKDYWTNSQKTMGMS